jgi:hypothetical protein
MAFEYFLEKKNVVADALSCFDIDSTEDSRRGFIQTSLRIINGQHQ